MKIEQIQNDAERDFVNSLVYLNFIMLGKTLDKYQIDCHPGVWEVIVELIEKIQNQNHKLPLKFKQGELHPPCSYFIENGISIFRIERTIYFYDENGNELCNALILFDLQMKLVVLFYIWDSSIPIDPEMEKIFL